MIYLLCFSFSPVKAQYFDLNNGEKSVKLHFKLVRNLVIIKLKINDKGPFNFILDTGVGLMIITDPSIVDSVNIIRTHIIKLRCLGQGDDLEAALSSPLDIRMRGIKSKDVGAAILKEGLL